MESSASSDRSALTLVAIGQHGGHTLYGAHARPAAMELRGGANPLGLLMTSTGVGALTGALYLAQRETVVGLGRIIMYATLVFGAGLVAFSMTTSLWLACVVLAIAGCGFMVHLAATNTILQTIVEERLRGRVMSFYTMAFFGTVPIGSLLGGYSDRSAPDAVRISGMSASLAERVRLYTSRHPLGRAAHLPRNAAHYGPAVDTGGKTFYRASDRSYSHVHQTQRHRENTWPLCLWSLCRRCDVAAYADRIDCGCWIGGLARRCRCTRGVDVRASSVPCRRASLALALLAR